MLNERARLIVGLRRSPRMTKDPTSATARTVVTFFACVALGGIVWFIAFARGFTGLDSASETDRHVLIWWCGGAFVVSAVAGALQRAVSLFWSTGFAIPMLGWGVLCALPAITDHIRVLWWTAYGVATSVCALVGAWVGRALSRRVRDTNTANPKALGLGH